MANTDLEKWLGTRSFADYQKEFDAQGYLIFENVIDADARAQVRAALAPFHATDMRGRNDFEGLKSNRVYGLMSKGDIFADLAIHPLVLAFVEAEFGESAWLSAFLSINIHPGETAQPWHYDDEHCRLPRPRTPLQLSAFWAIDAMTQDNGATEIIPQSHKWGDEKVTGATKSSSFSDTHMRDVNDDPGTRDDAHKVIMPAGALMLIKGTLYHRGGANKSDASRLILTPQYCPGWVRQLENMVLSTPPEIARTLPPRARELIGYSIHPPFMGYADGVHPEKTLFAK